MKTINALLMVTLLLFAFTMNAQNDEAYEKAKGEMIEMFGVVPSMFELYPAHAMPGAWEQFKAMNSPEAEIPAKYRELIQLAVASQIPCQYCVYFHAAAAIANGATDGEIKEAVAQGAQTRHWSMILQGNQVSFEEFKVEFDGMMEHMAKAAEED